MYRPKKEFNCRCMILNPTTKKENGKVVKIYSDSGDFINASFSTFGGTESVVNGIYTVIDTANIETWFRPDITSDTRIKMTDGRVYSVEGCPENIDMKNQFLKFKVKSLGC